MRGLIAGLIWIVACVAMILSGGLSRVDWLSSAVVALISLGLVGAGIWVMFRKRAA